MDSPDPTPVVEALIAALAEERWRDAAALFTPAVQAARKNEVLSEHRHGTLRPRALTDDVAGVESLEALAAMDPDEAFARCLEATDPRTQAAKVAAVLEAQYPEHAEQLARVGDEWIDAWNLRVVGTVVDGDQAWAVIRKRDASEDLAPPLDFPPDTVVLRRRNHGWRVSGELRRSRRWDLGGLSVTDDRGKRVFLPLKLEEEAR